MLKWKYQLYKKVGGWGAPTHASQVPYFAIYAAYFEIAIVDYRKEGTQDVRVLSNYPRYTIVSNDSWELV